MHESEPSYKGPDLDLSDQCSAAVLPGGQPALTNTIPVFAGREAHAAGVSRDGHGLFAFSFLFEEEDLAAN